MYEACLSQPQPAKIIAARIVGERRPTQLSRLLRTQGGNYTFNVSSYPPGLTSRNTTTVELIAGSPSPNNASLNISASSFSVGAVAVATMRLYDETGNPVFLANNVTLLIAGGVLSMPMLAGTRSVHCYVGK